MYISSLRYLTNTSIVKSFPNCFYFKHCYKQHPFTHICTFYFVHFTYILRNSTAEIRHMSIYNFDKYQIALKKEYENAYYTISIPMLDIF